jgi:GTP-binding protein
MKLEARFIASAFALGDCPRWDRIEVALAGRSNVGKSSLLNALTGVKGLARTSKTPGRTRCLNFFALGENLALVDLPGFGYAKMSRLEAAKLGRLMRTYLERRTNLVALVMLVDASLGPKREERELADMIRRHGLGLMVAATKTDKLSRGQRAAALERLRMLGTEPIMCSVADGEGIDELRRRVLQYARTPGRSRTPLGSQTLDNTP